MIDTKHIKLLLNQVNLINNTYQKLAKITGENFNIFRILDLHTKEVRLHSAFIAELLDTRGTHGLGNVFLKEFVKLIRSRKSNLVFDFTIDDTVNVVVEKWLGYKSETNGGYIDILLTDKYDRNIIIENKIFAGDQENQLLRYHNYKQHAVIVYLTLDGRKPSKYSTSDSESITNKIICISYKTDILQWLEISKQYAVNYPTIRETITQYILNLKHLTDQTMYNEQKKEIIDLILRSKEFISSAELINDLWNAAKIDLINSIQPEIKIIANKHNLEYHIDTNLCIAENGFWFYKKGWKCIIYFYLPTSNIRNVKYGVAHLDYKNKYSDEITVELRNHLKAFQSGEYSNDDDWFWVNAFILWRETSWNEFSEIIPGEIERITIELLTQLNNFENKGYSLS